MPNEKIKTELLDALHKPVLTRSQVEKIMNQSGRHTAELSKLPRDKGFPTINTWQAFALTIKGCALGFVLIAIVHYLGLDPWVESLFLR